MDATPVGVSNHGNSCYLNSGVQLLRRCFDFGESLLRMVPLLVEGGFVRALLETLCPADTSREVLAQVAQESGFDLFQQQDAGEFAIRCKQCNCILGIA